ncbi:hypothetical protein [Massilia sp. Root418]|jgi:hypothetical protein|nr:hypothetical protein [Massilia sp. Root418]
MSNKQLSDALKDTQPQQEQDLELTDTELDDVAGGGSCAAMCGTFSLMDN